MFYGNGHMSVNFEATAAFLVLIVSYGSLHFHGYQVALSTYGFKYAKLFKKRIGEIIKNTLYIQFPIFNLVFFPTISGISRHKLTFLDHLMTSCGRLPSGQNRRGGGRQHLSFPKIKPPAK